jgi:hypothetical protein
LPDLRLRSGRALLPGTAVPGDSGWFTVTLGNAGNIAATGRIGVKVYASVDTTLDAGDTLVAQAAGWYVNIAPNGAASINLPTTLPSDLLPATYHWLVSIDSSNVITESNELNNIVPLVAQSTEVVWKFGNFNGRRNVPLRVKDAAGVLTTFVLGGVGVGSVIGGPNFDEIMIVSTNAWSWVGVYPTGGQAHANTVTVRQPLSLFYAPSLVVNGLVTLDRPVSQFIIANPPVVSVSAPVPTSAEAGPTTGLIRITRSSMTTGSLAVQFSMFGSASRGPDYTLSVGGVPLTANTVVIPAGQDHLDVLVTPVDDAAHDPSETLLMLLRSGPVYTLAPAFGDRWATVTIADND